MASKAITGLRSEGTEAKRLVWNVAIDGIATGRGHAQPFGSTTAGAHCTYLEACQLPPALVHHHRLHGNCHPFCLLIMKVEKIQYKFQVSTHSFWILWGEERRLTFTWGETMDKKMREMIRTWAWAEAGMLISDSLVGTWEWRALLVNHS